MLGYLSLCQNGDRVSKNNKSSNICSMGLKKFSKNMRNRALCLCISPTAPRDSGSIPGKRGSHQLFFLSLSFQDSTQLDGSKRHLFKETGCKPVFLKIEAEGYQNNDGGVSQLESSLHWLVLCSVCVFFVQWSILRPVPSEITHFRCSSLLYALTQCSFISHTHIYNPHSPLD